MGGKVRSDSPRVAHGSKPTSSLEPKHIMLDPATISRLTMGCVRRLLYVICYIFLTTFGLCQCENLFFTPQIATDKRLPGYTFTRYFMEKPT